MLAPLVKFTDDAAALEKTLRLVQSICTIAIGLAGSNEVVGSWLQARKQIALGRRYFRLLKWHTHWTAAYTSFHETQHRTLEQLLAVTEKTFLGLYFFLEMFTIVRITTYIPYLFHPTNVMGVTTYDWGPQVQLQADRAWLYALIASIWLGLWRLFVAGPVVSLKEVKVDAKQTQNDEVIDEKKAALDEKKVLYEKAPPKAKVQTVDKAKIYRQLVIDCCDVCIPGSSIGLIPVSPTVVGSAQFISTILAGQVIWNRVQAQ
ncbi:Hypothetical protein R9X50_00666000 [Acrodontium crateriforme]|uniref:Peroxisomal biogenesis factor 11 n=1 Tax=Acrodontium crateriforme TaxID=150365 RepID=A0AAQ3M893_9PEZI|nr:Hypothetical protein R9X50_00666000 [Acrodontium crateriforme]